MNLPSNKKNKEIEVEPVPIHLSIIRNSQLFVLYYVHRASIYPIFLHHHNKHQTICNCYMKFATTFYCD